jgi:hypothetical protein
MSTAFSQAPRSKAIGAAEVKPVDHRPERESAQRSPVAVAGLAGNTDRDTSHYGQRPTSDAVANRTLDILRRRGREVGQGPDGGASPPGAPSTVIRRINTKNEQAKGRKVTHTEHAKWGTGTILGFQGPKYQVEFPRPAGKKWVPAEELAFADGDDGPLSQPDRKPTAAVLPFREIEDSDSNSSDTESDDARYIGTNPTPLASIKPPQRPVKLYGDNPKAGARVDHDERPHRGDTSSGPAVQADTTEGIIPTTLTVVKLVTSVEGVKSKKKKKKTLWVLTLTDGSNTLSETTVAEQDIKTVVENLAGNGARPEPTNTDPPKANANSPIPEGTYSLKPGLQKYGPLDDGLRATRTKRRKETEQAKALALLAERPVHLTGTAGHNRSQEQIQTHLKSLPKPIITEAGHKSVKMLKIALKAQHITLTVAGKPRAITHLYTQQGRPGELRCYLGNTDGAYQRVHTSLTDKFEAHTMVQTGDEVSVPGWDREKEKKVIVGTRVGYDSTEGVGPLVDQPGVGLRNTQVGPGIAARGLSIRSKSQTTVGPTLIAHPTELTKEESAACLHLASVFNVVLDQVFAELTGPNGSTAVTGITGDFKVLDETWLFDNGLPATPFNEFKQVRSNVGNQ